MKQALAYFLGHVVAAPLWVRFKVMTWWYIYCTPRTGSQMVKRRSYRDRIGS